MDAEETKCALRRAERKERKKMNRKLRKMLNRKNALETMDSTNKCLEISNDRKSCITAEMGTSLDVNSSSQSPAQEQSKIDTVSTAIIVERSATQQLKVDTMSTEVLEEKSAISRNLRKRLKRRRANVKDELEIVDPTKKCLEISTNEKSCIIADMGNILDVNPVPQSLSQKQPEFDTASAEIRTMEQPKVVTVSTESPVEKSASSKRKRRKLRRRMDDTKDELEILDPTKTCLEISTYRNNHFKAETDSTNFDINSTAQSQSRGKSEVDTVSTEIHTVEQPIVDTVSIEIPAIERAMSRKMRKRLKKRAENKNEVDIVDLTKKCLEISTDEKKCFKADMDTNLDGNSITQSLSPEQPKVDTLSAEIRTLEQPKVDTVSTESPGEKRGSSKRKGRKLRRTAKIKDGLEIVDPANKCLQISSNGKSSVITEMDTTNVNVSSTAQSQAQWISEVDAVSAEIQTMEQPIVNSVSTKMDTTHIDINSTARSRSQGKSELDAVSTEIRTMEQPMVDTVSTEAISKSMTKRLKRREMKQKELDILDLTKICLETSTNEKSCISTAQSLSAEQSEVDKVPDKIVIEDSANKKKKKKKKAKKEVQAADGISRMDQGDTILKDFCQLPVRSPVTRSRRILLILDVNGLLADIVTPPPKERKSDLNIYGRAIFKRPYYHDFLKFCFETFDVGIWSSRTKKVINRVVDYLLGGLKQKLLFCWDMSQTTQSKFKTLENKHKPLVCKEIKKLWAKCDPKLPWEKGYYDETNTLLIDDSPYKALLNPVWTAIFPHSYTYKDQNDNALGPGGDIRVYLQNLAKTENVQKYVEQHPFGQNAIGDTNPSWSFYSGVLKSLLSQRAAREAKERQPQPDKSIKHLPSGTSLSVQLTQDTYAMEEA